MKLLISVTIMACMLSVSLATTMDCNFVKLHQMFSNKDITLMAYTAQYKKCIGEAAASVTPRPVSNSPVTQKPIVTQGPVATQGPAVVTGQQTANGFQPSCTTDAAVMQAIVKINNQGTFQAADNRSYPFHIRGVVTLSQIDALHTRIQATFTGVSAFTFDSQLFSIHVHQKGEINPTCSSTGGHYNPCSTNHSNDPAVADRHIGDINRLTIPAGDVLTIDVIDPQVKLSGSLSVLGRSITVHAGSKSTRVGCGTIAVTDWEGAAHSDLRYEPTNAFWTS